MKRIVLSSILIFNILFTFAQVTIRGTVTLCENGEPATGAIVLIGGTEVSTITFTDFPKNFDVKHYSSENDTVKLSYFGLYDKIGTKVGVFTLADLNGNFGFEYHVSENDTIKFSHLGSYDEIRTIKVSDDDCSDKIYTINVCLKDNGELKPIPIHSSRQKIFSIQNKNK